MYLLNWSYTFHRRDKNKHDHKMKYLDAKIHENLE